MGAAQARPPEFEIMKVTGFILLMAGWVIVLAAVALLAAPARAAFVLAGLGVELIGLVLAARAERPAAGGRG